MRTLMLALAGALAFTWSALGQEIEKPDLKLGVGGATLLYYLPLAIADRKGFFKDEGLNVEVNDFKGGSQSLQALLGGSADIVTGAYEHTIRMQTKGQDIRAVIELGRFPAIVLAIKSSLKDEVKSVADLKGRNIGVTAPGSSTNNFVNYLLSKEGVKPDEVSIIGVGAGSTAIAGMKRGEIDAISNLDPVITTLETQGDIVVLADSRTEEGMMEIFGSTSLPAAVLYAKGDFIEQNPNTVQALVNALYKALKWLETASPEEVADTVPPEFVGDNRELYVEAVRNSLPTYSRTGLVTDEGIEAAMKLLSFDAEVASAQIDRAATFDPTFVQKAAAN
jgi:NitT/TauT family transport system substrate-binding protein